MMHIGKIKNMCRKSTLWLTLGLLLMTVVFHTVQAGVGDPFYSGQIERFSSLGRSFALNQGSLSGIKMGEEAQFFLLSEGDGAIVSIGRAKALSVTQDRSHWLFEQRRHDIRLEAPAQVKWQYTAHYDLSLRPLELRQRRVIRDAGNFTLKRHDSFQQHKIKGSDQEIEILLGASATNGEADVIIDEYDEWYLSRQKTHIPELRRHFYTHYPAQYEGEGSDQKERVRRRTQSRIYNKIADAHVRKHQQMAQDLESFYFPVKTDPSHPSMRRTLTVDNVYEKYQRQKREPPIGLDKAYAQIEREGPLWSAGMEERELRSYFINNGIAEERARKERALKQGNNHEIYFELATGLSKTFDESYTDLQGTNYSFSLGYEFHLGRTMSALNRFSLQAMVERSVSFVDVIDFNAIYREGYFGLIGHYYFYNTPMTLRDYLFHVGLGVKRGNGTMSAGALRNDYDVQSLRFPLMLGMKYRFRGSDERTNWTQVGWGLNLRLSYEVGSKRVVGFVEENFKREVNPGDLKLHFGLSSYF